MFKLSPAPLAAGLTVSNSHLAFQTVPLLITAMTADICAKT